MKTLLDKENAVLIGTAIDELIRHHPSLKTPVFQALKSTLTKIEDMGNVYKVPEEIRQWYQLTPIPTPVAFSDGDVPMVDAAPNDPVQQIGDSGEPTGEPDLLYDDEIAAPKPHDNNVVSCIDILGRVKRMISLPPISTKYVAPSSWKVFSSTPHIARILSLRRTGLRVLEGLQVFLVCLMISPTASHLIPWYR